MAKVISLANYSRDEGHLPDASQVEDNSDMFLVTEGLDLLASYRSIKDRPTRLRLKALIDEAARSQASVGSSK